MEKTAELSLIELVMQIRCTCGEQFNVDGMDEKETCPACNTVYKVHVTFQDFYVKEIP